VTARHPAYADEKIFSALSDIIVIVQFFGG